MSRFILLVSVGTLLVMTACSRMPSEDGSSLTTTPAATRLFQPVSTATAETPLPETAPTVSPTAEQPPSIIDMDDQVLTEDGQLTIDRIVTNESAWAVIYNDDSGEAGEILGYVEVAAGDNQEIVVTIDSYKASPTLFAMLHLDEGQNGTFEYPGPDRPVRSGNDMVVDPFEVDIQIYFPGVSVNDQDVAEDGLVIVQQVTAVEPSWIVLHADDEGEPGRMLAYAPLKTGVNEDIKLTIDWRTVPPRLHVVMVTDGGQPGQFEDAAIDQPIEIDGQPVTAVFEVVLAPDIYILDQPVAEGTIVVERVISYEPSWLVVYNQNEDESLGNIIGWSPLAPGINTQVVVTVTESAVSPILYTMLHEDLDEVGEFEFPRTDRAMSYEDGMHPFAFRTDAGNYLVTRDQALSSSDTVTVSLVVVDEDAWVVVYADEEGQLGEIAGRRWVPVGVTRDIAVTLNSDVVTPTMHVVLHLDAGIERVFDFPEGLDIPFQRNRNIIQAPIRLIENNS